jgi:hypothetical protein
VKQLVLDLFATSAASLLGLVRAFGLAPVKRAALLLFLGSMVTTSVEAANPRTIRVNADGSFTPRFLLIHDGDTVEWELSSVTDSIIPIDTTGARDLCSAYKPFHPGGANEFTGPLPRAASGLFTLGPDGPGFVVKRGAAQCNPVAHPECKAAAVGTGATTQCLCATGEPYATMDTTWGDPDIAGVFIRLRWKDVHKGPGVFDWTAMDREIAKAVQHGKLYSLAFKAGHFGTPDWIFEPQIGSAAPSSRRGGEIVVGPTTVQLAVRRIKFQDHGEGTRDDESEDGEPGHCGTILHLGSPADTLYRGYYFELLRAAAQRIRSKNAWYRALAYIKPSGVNLFTHENRAPHRCDPGCRICNPERWVTQGDYTPTALKDFYQEQMNILAAELPDKDMSYMLIQDGFPQVNDFGDYLGKEGVEAWTPEDVVDPCEFPPAGKVPTGVQQTECVLQIGMEDHKTRFVVAHNGLRPPCGDDPLDDDDRDECLPNRWVRARDGTQVVGFQTSNATRVGNSIQLEQAFQNGYCNSLATFFEIYEERLWEPRMESAGVLDPGGLGSIVAGCKLPIPTGRSLGSWAAMLHDRRQTRSSKLDLPDAFPKTHRHTFKRTTNDVTQPFAYVHGSKCSEGKYGVVTIVPWIVTTRIDESSTAPVAGYDSLGPADKPTPSTVNSRLGIASHDGVGLNGISLLQADSVPCSLSLALQDLPGQPEVDTDLGINASLSGPSTCTGPTLAGTAKFEAEQVFVRGVRVCTSGDIPRVRGIEIHAAKVNDDGTVTPNAQPSKRFAVDGCNAWSAAAFCPKDQIAVGARGYFTDAGGFSGIALQCSALEAQ